MTINKEDRKPIYWDVRVDAERLYAETMNEAINRWLDDQHLDADGMEELTHIVANSDEITVYGFAKRELNINTESILDVIYEDLNIEYGDMEGDFLNDPTDKVKVAMGALAAQIKEDWHMWQCECVAEKKVVLVEWLEANDQETLKSIMNG